MQVWQQEIRDDVYSAILRAADTYGVPRGLMFSLAKFESGFRPEAVNSVLGALGTGEYSVGLFQFNMRGGMGVGHSEENLKNPDYNANLAGWHLTNEYQKHGNWWDASWPWGARSGAFAWWNTNGDPTGQESEPPSQAQPLSEEPVAEIATRGPLLIGGVIILAGLAYMLSSLGGGDSYVAQRRRA